MLDGLFQLNTNFAVMETLPPPSGSSKGAPENLSLAAITCGVDYIITRLAGAGRSCWYLIGLNLSSSLCTFVRCTARLAQDCPVLRVSLSSSGLSLQATYAASWPAFSSQSSWFAALVT